MTISTKKLGDVCEVVGGGTPSTRVLAYWDGGIVWVTPKDLGKLQETEVFASEKTISQEGLKKSSAKLLPIGSVVLSSRAPIGYVAIAGVPLATNQGCRNFICDEKQLYNKYLYYFLVSKTAYLNSLGGGSTFKEVSGSKLKEVEIPLPSLSEQKKIVARLETVLGKIKEAKRLRAEAEAAASTLLSAELHKVFQEGKQKGWGDVGLDEVCEIASTLVDPRESCYLDMLHVGGANIRANTGELVDLKTSREEKLISGKFLFDESMVLYSKIRPYLMKVARPAFKGLCSADIYPLSPVEGKVTQGFLFYLLLTDDFTRYAIKGSGRAGMPKVNRAHLFGYRLLLPPLAEQKKIVAHLDALSAKIAQVREYQKATAADLDALEKSVLAKAFAPQTEKSTLTKSPIKVAKKDSQSIPSPFYRNQVFAAIIEQVVKDSGDTTEVAVAKYNHLLQEVMGLSLGYEFQTHQFGPFDGRIKQLMYSGLGKNQWFTKKRGNIVPGSNMGALLAKKTNLYKEAQSAMSTLSRKGITKLDATRLELLSTICHSIKVTQSTDLNDITDFMSKWRTNDSMTKAEKFSKDQVQRCLEFILKEGLHARLLPAK